jgi:hypothetical protein
MVLKTMFRDIEERGMIEMGEKKESEGGESVRRGEKR